MTDPFPSKTRLFTVLPLENRHKIALYRSDLQFLFFERFLARISPRLCIEPPNLLCLLIYYSSTRIPRIKSIGHTSTKIQLGIWAPLKNWHAGNSGHCHTCRLSSSEQQTTPSSWNKPSNLLVRSSSYLFVCFKIKFWWAVVLGR